MKTKFIRYHRYFGMVFYCINVGSLVSGRTTLQISLTNYEYYTQKKNLANVLALLHVCSAVMHTFPMSAPRHSNYASGAVKPHPAAPAPLHTIN